MKIKVLIMLLTGIGSLVQAQNLRQVVNIALNNNTGIQALRQQVTAAEAAGEAVFRSTLPQLRLKSSASFVTDMAEINLAKLTGMPLGTVSLGTRQTYEAGLNLTYILFSGFATQAKIKMSRCRKNISRIQLSGGQRETAFQTVSAYRAIQDLRLKIASLESASYRAELHLRQVRSLITNGMALAVDTLTLSLGRLAFEQKLITARAALESTSQKLKVLTNLSISVNIPDTVIQNKYAQLDITALDLIRGFEVKQQLAQAAVTAVRSDLYPKIALQAAYKYGKPGVDPITNKWMDYGFAGLALEWNIFQWGATRQQVRSKQAALKQIILQKEQAEKEVRLLYDMKIREFNSTRKQLKVVKTRLKLAKEKMRIYQLQSQEGMISATDFNAANLELARVELDLQEHLIKLAKIVNEIDYYSGSPIESWYFE